MGRNESILNRNFTDNDISEEEWIDHFENENQNQNQNAHILTREETVDGIRDEGYDDTIDAVIREVDVKKSCPTPQRRQGSRTRWYITDRSKTAVNEMVPYLK